VRGWSPARRQACRGRGRRSGGVRAPGLRGQSGIGCV